MKCVFVLFDTLNRRSLRPYNPDAPAMPNFERLAARSTTFDNHYVGSLPCIPARRELHTGRYNFMHRSWGPLEPFDESLTQNLVAQNVYSHMVTDHCHYFMDGGATYHTRYDSYEFVRGQEKDPWKAEVAPAWDALRPKYHPTQFSDQPRNKYRQHIINRQSIQDEADYPSVRCFDAAIDFLEKNGKADNWLLHLETFDPHEPFQAPERFRKSFPTPYDGPILDWPPQGKFDALPEEIAELRANYHANLALCDELLGRLLDHFDAHDLWQDTALIVTTDHGFLLGEHDYWAKNAMPVFNEVAHIPLFIWHPDHADAAGARRRALTQTIDLAPTIADVFGAPPPQFAQGFSLLPVLEDDRALREAALFGLFGCAVNITDGRYTYFRYPPDVHGGDLFQYTLMPTHIAARFSKEELRDMELAGPFAFTDGVRTLRVASTPKSPFYNRMGPGQLTETKSMQFDLKRDPMQLAPEDDPVQIERLTAMMLEMMRASEAPPELYARLGLKAPS